MAGSAAPAEGRGAGFWGDGEQHAPWEEEHGDSSLLHQSRYDGFEMDRGGRGGRSLGPSGPGPPAKRMRGAGMEGYEYGYPGPAPGGYGGREGMGGGYGEGGADFGGPPGMLPRGGPFGPPGGAMGMQHRIPNGGQGQGFAPGAGAGAGSGAGAFPPAGQGGGAELCSGAAAAAGRGGGGGGGGGGRGRGTGGIFFKTKLCSRFKSGSCPYNSNCNFAHGMEELRRPPRGWEEFVAQDGGYGGGSVTPPTPVPQGQGQGQGQGLGQGGQGLQNGLTADSLKFHKTRPCKKYFNEGNCPYGDRCNFLHDEPGPQARGARDTPVISGAAPLSPGGASSGSGGVTARPPNWKTRICNKWEVTGHCPFGDKCHFAHGSAELQSYGGGPFDSSNGGSGGGTPTEVKSSTKQWEVGMTDSQPAGTSQGLISKQGRHSVRTAAGERTKALWKESLTEICNVYADWVGVDKGKIWNENEKYSSPKLPEHMGQLVYGREEKPDVGEFCGQDGDAYLKVDGSHAFPAQRHMNGLQNGFHGVGNGVIHSLQNQVDYGYYGQEGSNYDGP